MSFEIVERGSGAPLVLIPGIQGRWQYSRGLLEALARSYRVVTFSLWDERRGRRRTAAPTIDVFSGQVEAALDRLNLPAAHIVGVSFGGLVALRFAATRPKRTTSLVMISAPGPRWHLRPRHDIYARLPWVFGPVFLIESPFRLRHEVKTALPDGAERRQCLREQLRTLVTSPISISRMAARARLIAGYDRSADARTITAPTLVVQGEDALDHVTGSGGTAEYARLVPGARHEVLERTGHLGSVTRADECAALVHRFLQTTKDANHSAA
jgi:pimeloyl-ACP methyl ester carboxylesterase